MLFMVISISVCAQAYWPAKCCVKLDIGYGFYENITKLLAAISRQSLEMPASILRLFF